MKKRIDIEALVQWAYRDELPKARHDPALVRGPASTGNEWGGMATVALLGQLVDDEPALNRYGLVSITGAASGPHADALAVAKAVDGLEAFSELVFPDDWNPLSDLGDLSGFGPGLARDALEMVSELGDDGVRRLRMTPKRLVMKYAILGSAPDWHAEVPKARFVTDRGMPRWFRKRRVTDDGAFGPVVREIEVDGFDQKKRRPYPGAYRRLYLDPSPLSAAVARAEYEVWMAALGVLAEDLASTLEAHEVTGCARPARPWEQGESRARPVLRDVRQGRYFREDARS